MRVLLAGATGTAGKAVLHALLQSNHSVVAVARTPPQRAQHPNLTWLSWKDLDRASHASAPIDIVISCLASRSGSIQDSHEVDYLANQRLLDWASQHGIGHFILLSAICVQKPRLAFQHAKLRFENALRNAEIPWTIIRPTAFFKSLAGQIPRIQRGKPFLVFGDGELTACKPISERDLADYIVACIGNPLRMNQTLPIGGPGPAITPLDQAIFLSDAFKKPIALRSVSPKMFDAAEWGLDRFSKLSGWCRDKAEFCRIGKYYATESMLIWDAVHARYSAEQTPETGSDTLADFYQKIASGESLQPSLGEHSLF